LLKEIKDIYMNSRGPYGSPRIKEELIRRNYNISRPRVARLMRKENIRSVVKKKYVVTTDSKHKYPVAPNVLKRNFTVEAPRKVWVSDITYISTQQGWVYLTVVIDLFDRKVVGWALSETMKVSDTTVPALQMAVKNRGVNSSLIFHSDRGVQYACNEFKAILKHYNIIQSTPSESLGLEKEIVGTMQ
jgi:transposase InsO family protein